MGSPAPKRTYSIHPQGDFTKPVLLIVVPSLGETFEEVTMAEFLVLGLTCKELQISTDSFHKTYQMVDLTDVKIIA